MAKKDSTPAPAVKTFYADLSNALDNVDRYTGVATSYFNAIPRLCDLIDDASAGEKNIVELTEALRAMCEVGEMRMSAASDECQSIRMQWLRAPAKKDEVQA